MKKYFIAFSFLLVFMSACFADTTSILIKELRQYGCPVVCSNWNALPEQIENGVSGFVWDIESGVDELADIVGDVLRMDLQEYLKLRKTTQTRSLSDLTYRQIAEEILKDAFKE